MALPKVTPGTYDYGAYARPTQVKYNAAGDAVLGQAIGTSIQGIGQLVGEAVKKNKAFKEETYKNMALLEAEKREDFHAKTTQRINDISEEYSAFRNPKTARQLKRKDPKKFYAEELRYKNEIDSILAMDKLNIDPDVLSQFRKGDIKQKDEEKFFIAQKLANSDYYLKESNGRTNLVYEDEEGNEQELLLSDVVDNIEKYTDFQEAFNYGNKEYVSQINNSAEYIGKNASALFMKEPGAEVIDGLLVMDQDSAKQSLIDGSQKGLLTPLIAEYGDVIIEDILSRENPNMSVEEANKRVREVLAEQIVAKIPQFAKDPNKMTIDQQLRLKSIKLQERVFNKEVQSEKEAMDYTEQVFKDVRQNISRYFEKSTGKGIGGYNKETGILTYFSKDEQGNVTKKQVNMVTDPAGRKMVYKAIYDDFIAPGIDKDFTEAAERKLDELLRQNPAFTIEPENKPEDTELKTVEETELKPTGQISDMPTTKSTKEGLRSSGM